MVNGSGALVEPMGLVYLVSCFKETAAVRWIDQGIETESKESLCGKPQQHLEGHCELPQRTRRTEGSVPLQRGTVRVSARLGSH